MYKHIILFNFSNKLTHKDCMNLLKELGELKLLIPEILNYKYGVNEIGNLHNKSFDYAFIMSFYSKLELEIYQKNTYHQKYISEKLNDYIDDAIVFNMECE